MFKKLLLLFLTLCMTVAYNQTWAQKSPLDELPDYISRITHFGQRADWSHDGKRILFLEKTFGDVYEIDLETLAIKPITHHFHHEGFVRALYLSNGDILLSGDPTFDAENPMPSRWNEAELWVLDKNLEQPPVPLNQKCSEGPAVSRNELKIAYTIDHGDYPDELEDDQSQIWTAEIDYIGGKPTLRNKKLILDDTKLDFETGLETQNFRPPHEKEIIFSAYGYQGTEVMGVNIETGEVINYSKAPNQYDEPEGIFPNGDFTLVECDKHKSKGKKFFGSQYIDLWKLALDGSGDYERITYFNDYEGYKASNPVVSDDGKYIAFQMAKVGDMAGVGRGLFIYDLEKAENQ